MGGTSESKSSQPSYRHDESPCMSENENRHNTISRNCCVERGLDCLGSEHGTIGSVNSVRTWYDSSVSMSGHIFRVPHISQIVKLLSEVVTIL